MSDPLFAQDDAATPLTEEEKNDLIPSYVTLRRELNEIEQANIIEAEQWAFNRRRDVLDEAFLLSLHKRMFGQVWKWAGKIRKTDRNIGVDPWKIEVELRQLIDDTKYWIEHETYPLDEIAARFHHKLVWIHPFPNGNGRHSRMATDLLMIALGRPRFTWGSASLIDPNETRRTYVSALRAADKHDLELLLAFVRA